MHNHTAPVPLCMLLVSIRSEAGCGTSDTFQSMLLFDQLCTPLHHMHKVPTAVLGQTHTGTAGKVHSAATEVQIGASIFRNSLKAISRYPSGPV